MLLPKPLCGKKLLTGIPSVQWLRIKFGKVENIRLMQSSLITNKGLIIPDYPGRTEENITTSKIFVYLKNKKYPKYKYLLIIYRERNR